ncbi:MAG: hypothetical protein DRQ43_07860 [Gammaproteobacteria bacterium]|nr:MAG: hypothetical protein DRQ43_07860 [Gammaproteobacteria bacterium]
MKKFRYLNSVLALLVASKSGEDDLAPASSLNDEDFDKAFDSMMREPSPSEETVEETPIEEAEPESESVSEDVDDDSEDNQEEEVEQAEAEEESKEQDPDEETASDDESDDTKDSTKEEPTESEGFDFNSIPMDQVIPMEINANGMKMKATMNELVAGFQKGMHYTKKMQELSGVKRLVSIATSNGLSEEDLNLLVEAKGGNQEAIAKIMSAAKVDPLDIDTDEHKDYSPADYGKDEVDIDMDMVVKTIKADTEASSYVEDAIQNMPQDMYDMVSGSADNLDSLYKDVKNGTYSKVMPEVVKLQALYGKSEPTIDTYIKVANQLMENKTSVQETPKESPEEKKARSNNRKKVASTSKAPVKKKSYIKDDVKSLGDDDFDKEFEKIMGRSINDYK